MNASTIRLRPMKPSDVTAVVALEEASQFTPWTEGNFRDALAAGNLCLVAEREGAIIASAVLQMAAGDTELLAMAVDPLMRRQGLGRRMVAELVARALSYRAESMWLEVRASNRAAIGLYRQAGFDEVGRRKDYYLTAIGREDALMMRLALRNRQED